MGMVIRYFMFVLFLSFLGTELYAADRYYSSSGSGSTCSEGLPCSTATLVANLSACTGADDFYMKRGDTFTIPNWGTFLVIGCSGTSSNPVILGAYGSGALPIIYGLGRDDASGIWTRPILATQKDWLIIENIEITNTALGIVCIGCRDTIVRGMYIHDIAAQSIYIPGTFNGQTLTRASARVLLENNTLHAVGQDLTPPVSAGEGFYIGTDPAHGLNPDFTTDVTIRNNLVYNCKEECIECKPDTINCVIEDNIVHTTNNKVGILISGGSGARSNRNLVFNVGYEGINIGGTSSNPHENLTASYNMVESVGYWANHDGNCIEIRSTVSTGSLVHHNSCYSVDGAGILDLSTAVTPTDNLVQAAGSGNSSPSPAFVAPNATPFGQDFTPTNATYFRTGANGTDVGAVQRLLCDTRSIENATPNKLSMSCNGVFPVTLCTHAPAVVNVATVNRTSTACGITGSNTVEVTFDGAPVTNGQTVLVTLPKGTIRAGNVGLTASPYRPHHNVALSSASVTNNVGAAPSGVVRTQTASACHTYGADVTIDDTTNGAWWNAKEGLTCLVGVGVVPPKLLVALQVSVTGANEPEVSGKRIQCQDNSGGYYDVTNVFGANKVAFINSPQFDNLDTIASELLNVPAGLTFTTDGRMIENNTAFPGYQLLQDEYTDMLFSLQFNVVDGDVIECRLVLDNGAVFDAYTYNGVSTIATINAVAGLSRGN